MSHPYKIRLVARNEVVEYQDKTGIYWFDVTLNKDTWTLFLPGKTGQIGHVETITDAEMERIVPAVTKFLINVKWFIFFGGPYKVEIKPR